MTEREFLEQIELNKQRIHSVCNIYCNVYERSDLVQDIIIETWKSLSNWKNNCKFSTWLYAVARNVCIDKLRKIKKEPEIVDVDEYADVLAEVDNTPELIKQLRQAKRYNAVVDSIDEPFKTLFIMYVEGLSYEEMQQQTGVSAQALRVKICKIKKRLQLRYGNKVIS